MPRSPNGWIPCILFNAYVQLDVYFNQLCLYFNNRPSTETHKEKLFFSTSAKNTADTLHDSSGVTALFILFT